MNHCTIFDYGVGNLHSLQKALERAGARTRITTNPADLATAERIVLPGVGAFGPAARRIAPAAPSIRNAIANGTPLLGICLGMQLLYAASEEAPGTAGLGIIPGTVRKLEAEVTPIIGWNAVTGDESTISSGAYYYFVHGYGAPVGPHTTSTADHGGTCTATVRQGAALGMQFHPEKSGKVGIETLARWLQ